MNLYYLLASLPSLSMHSETLPISRTKLWETLESNLEKEIFQKLKGVSLKPENGIAQDSVMKIYHDFERGMRNTLVHGLASSIQFIEENHIQPGDTLHQGIEAGREALNQKDPLQRQLFIATERWKFIQQYWGEVGFSFLGLQLYCLKWYILEEKTSYQHEEGEIAFNEQYQKIFASLGSLTI